MLFDRVASLVIGKSGGKGRELSGLRFSFSIQKGATKSPNQCTLHIYNCSKDTRSTLEVIGSAVILKAGYREDVGAATIFVGTVIRTLTRREGADLVTELELADGFLEFRDKKATISFAPGVTMLQVVTNVAEKFGLPVRPLPADIPQKQYSAGFAFVGRVRDAMDKVCENAGLEWSIQNGELQVIKKGGVFKKVAYLISAETGMIDSPELEMKTMSEKSAAKEGITEKQPGVRKVKGKETTKAGEEKENLQVFGYKVKSLLQPLIEPGGYVKIKSKSIDGFFRVEELTSIGDTHGSDWHTHLLLRYI